MDLVGNSIRPNLNTDLELSNMTIEEILAAGGRTCSGRCAGCRPPPATASASGNVGRNTLRADGIGNLDVAFIKNTRMGGHRLQVRIEMFNATNTRNFGIPGRAHQQLELPESVGHERRGAHDLGSAALHLLAEPRSSDSR